MGEVYLAENIVNNKIYVGKTITTMESRKRKHLSDAKKGRGYYFQNALRQYGPESFTWRVLFTSDDEIELFQKEIEYIAFYQSSNPTHGYNLTYGGEGQRCTEATKQKLRLANLGKKGWSRGLTKETNPSLMEISNKLTGRHLSPEHAQKTKEGQKRYYETHDGANKGKKLSKEQCERMKQIKGEKHWAYGKHISEEQKKAISKAQKGRIRTPEEIEKNRQGHLGKSPWNKGVKLPEQAKPVRCLETQEVFSSCQEASDKYPSAGTHISQVCSGKRKTAGGFHWEYVDDKENPLQ